MQPILIGFFVFIKTVKNAWKEELFAALTHNNGIQLIFVPLLSTKTTDARRYFQPVIVNSLELPLPLLCRCTKQHIYFT
jgi:hypothetical protein